MPISNSYPKGIPIEDQDLFVGTKAANNRTVNYTAQGVADYLNINSKVAIGGQMSFQFTIVPNIPKTIAFEGGGGNNTAFSAITKLIVSAIDLSTANITIFLNYLNNSQVLLSQQNQPNFFGHYKITGYTQIGTSAFYELDLEFIGGNGTIGDKQYYDLISFVLSTEVPPTEWGTITGDIEDQTDLIDYISSQITTPTLQNVLTAGREFDETTGNESSFIKESQYFTDRYRTIRQWYSTVDDLTVANTSFDTKEIHINTLLYQSDLWNNSRQLGIQSPNPSVSDNSRIYTEEKQNEITFDNSVITIEVENIDETLNTTTNYIFKQKAVTGDYEVATTDDITTPTLQQVTDEGNTTTNEIIVGTNFTNGLTLNQQYANIGLQDSTYVYQSGIIYSNFFSSADEISTGKSYVASLSAIEGMYLNTFGSSGYVQLKSDLVTTVQRTIQFPDASGTIALTSDIPAVGFEQNFLLMGS